MASNNNSLAGLRIRKSHPALFYTLMTLGIMTVLLGLNFWFSTPAFNPYEIDKDIIGLIFFLIGICQVVFLNFFHNLRMVRGMLGISVGWMFFWGVSNAQQFFMGLASLQLPIIYIALAIMQIPLLMESPINPMTEKK